MKMNLKRGRAILILPAIAIILTSGCGGGGAGGLRMPTLSMTYPSAASVTDSDFQADTFYLQFSYSSDCCQINSSTLSVSLSMDGGAPTDITSYFMEVDSSTAKSNNLHVFSRTLFELASNNQERTITVTASIQDSHGKEAQTTASFTVTPTVAPPAPPL